MTDHPHAALDLRAVDRFVLIVCGLLLAACSPTIATPIFSPSPVSTCKYQAGGALPDPVCTPGSTDPSVTQDTIATTICQPGYTARIRPPVDYTSHVKRTSMRDYGVSDQDPRNYELDHLISLELGGAPRDPANLWPQPGASPNPKDRIENNLHAAVCSGRMTLAEAQRRIATDWRAAGEMEQR